MKIQSDAVLIDSHVLNLFDGLLNLDRWGFRTTSHEQYRGIPIMVCATYQ